MQEDPTTLPPAEHAPSVTTTPSPVTLPADFAPPNELPTIPGFALERELGRGGMGVVYLARHLGLDRLVALKVVLFAEHASGELRRRFVSEARTVARLSHPNIVQIYDVAEHKGLPYFSLEYCAGGTLADRLAKGPMPPREAAELVRTLALAVHAAHEAGIIHRDLKPGNILLTADGTPRVADFGLARRADAGQHTQSGAILGTPSYMAPEQARAKSSEIGPHTDVWALGAILYECLTGRPPFKASSSLDTLMQVVERQPQRPRQLSPDVPRDLEAICLSCLDKLPAGRPASAKELAERLGAFLEGKAWQGTPRRAWGGRHVAAGMLLVAAVALAVGVWAWQRPGGSTEPAATGQSRPGDEAVAVEANEDDQLIIPQKGLGRGPKTVEELAEALRRVNAKEQQNPERIKPTEKPTLYGLVVGINDFSRVRPTAAAAAGRRALLTDLRLAVTDARTVHAAFTAQKGRYYKDVKLDLLVDKQFTREAVLQRLAALRKVVTPNDRLLLFFSGHEALVDETGTTGTRYEFVCHDSDMGRPETLLPAKELFEAIRPLPCPATLILDICHAGLLFAEPGLDPDRHVLLAACGADQQALELDPEVVRKSGVTNLSDLKNGLFSALLMKAFENMATADLNDDGVLDTNELHLYIKDAMPNVLRRLRIEPDTQTPQLFPPEKSNLALGLALRPKPAARR